MKKGNTNIVGSVQLAGDDGTIGQVLTTDGAGGVSWEDGGGGGFTDPMTTRGDIIYRNSSNVTDRLGIGTNGYYIISNGTDIFWNEGDDLNDVCRKGAVSDYSMRVSIAGVDSFVRVQNTVGDRSLTMNAGHVANGTNPRLTAVNGDGFGIFIDTDQRFFIDGTTGAVSFNDAYSFPVADGTIGQVLTTNGTGTLTFQDGGGATPSLQDVTDVGATTTNDITITETGSNEAIIHCHNTDYGRVTMKSGYATLLPYIGTTTATDLNIGTGGSPVITISNSLPRTVIILNPLKINTVTHASGTRIFFTDLVEFQSRIQDANDNLFANVEKVFSFTIQNPLSDVPTKFPLWVQDVPSTNFVISRILLMSDIDYDCTLVRYPSISNLSTSSATILSAEIDNAGSGVYSNAYSSFTTGTIINGMVIVFEKHATLDPTYVHITIRGHYVNAVS